MTGKLRAKWQRPYWAVPLVYWLSTESLENRHAYIFTDYNDFARWHHYEQWAQYYFRRAACFLGMVDVGDARTFFGTVRIRTIRPECYLSVGDFANVTVSAEGPVEVDISPMRTWSHPVSRDTQESFLLEAARNNFVWSRAWRDDGRSAKHLKNLRHAARMAEKACRGSVFNEELSD